MVNTITQCRLTEFCRRRWCVYPLYGLILFALWRVVDRVWCMPTASVPWQENVIVGVGQVLFPAAYAVVLWWPLRREGLRRVWTRLREKHPTECPWCRYDTRGCTTPLCPECGKLTDPNTTTPIRA